MNHDLAPFNRRAVHEPESSDWLSFVVEFGGFSATMYEALWRVKRAVTKREKSSHESVHDSDPHTKQYKNTRL